MKRITGKKWKGALDAVEENLKKNTKKTQKKLGEKLEEKNNHIEYVMPKKSKTTKHKIILKKYIRNVGFTRPMYTG